MVIIVSEEPPLISTSGGFFYFKGIIDVLAPTRARCFRSRAHTACADLKPAALTRRVFPLALAHFCIDALCRSKKKTISLQLRKTQGVRKGQTIGLLPAGNI